MQSPPSELEEILSFSGKPSNLHPIKLDRWWRFVVGAPDLIYLQMGFHTIFEQIDRGALAIKTMQDLVGRDLPLTHQEIAQRHIGSFGFWITSENPDSAPDDPGYKFTVHWNKEDAQWELRCKADLDTLPDAKRVDSLEAAVEAAFATAKDLDSSKREGA